MHLELNEDEIRWLSAVVQLMLDEAHEWETMVEGGRDRKRKEILQRAQKRVVELESFLDDVTAGNISITAQIFDAQICGLRSLPQRLSVWAKVIRANPDPKSRGLAARQADFYHSLGERVFREEMDFQRKRAEQSLEKADDADCAA